MPNRRDSASSVEARSSGDDDESWEQDGEATGFTEADKAVIYGVRRAPTIGEEPGLSRATVQMNTFGKSERLASKDGMSPLSRLKSIQLDATFVKRVRAALPHLKTYANLRNGLWYLNPPADGDCRFRSSDGHALSWNFYIARANLHAAVAAIQSKGLMIVDSTRFGKTFPDSFNRTVPLWCAVMNRALGFKDAQIDLPRWLPGSERSRLTNEQLDGWAEEVRGVARKSGVELKSPLPLRPFWIGNDKATWNRNNNDVEVLVDRIDAFSDTCLPIVCVSASAVIDPAVHREQFSWSYIPGAADDEENWAPGGFSPAMFWANSEELLDAGNLTDCENIIGKLLRDQRIESVSDAALGVPCSCEVNAFLKLVWGAKPGTTLRKAKPNEYDATWIKGQDKAWGRKHPTAWPDRALPEVLGSFARRKEASDSFVIIGEDLETVATLAAAVLTVFFEDQGRNLRPDGRLVGIIDKTRLRASEGFIVSLIQQEALAIPRRLVKELIDFFSKLQWSHKIAWTETLSDDTAVKDDSAGKVQ